MSEWKKQQSDKYPEFMSYIDNKYWVRKNIKEVTVKEDDVPERTMYEYEEAKMTEAEYSIYLNEYNLSLINWVALEAGIDMPE